MPCSAASHVDRVPNQDSHLQQDAQEHFNYITFYFSMTYRLGHLIFIAGPNATSINTPCQVCSITMGQGEVKVPGRKTTHGGDVTAAHQG